MKRISWEEQVRMAERERKKRRRRKKLRLTHLVQVRRARRASRPAVRPPFFLPEMFGMRQHAHNQMFRAKEDQ